MPFGVRKRAKLQGAKGSVSQWVTEDLVLCMASLLVSEQFPGGAGHFGAHLIEATPFFCPLFAANKRTGFVVMTGSKHQTLKTKHPIL
jgi:hypothetical protein